MPSSSRGGARLRHLARWAVDHPVLATLAVAAVARLGLAVGSFVFLDGYLVPDELQYLQLAEAVSRGFGAEAWVAGYGQSLYDSTWTFMAPFALLSKLFGASRLNGQLVAVAGGLATAGLTAGLVRSIVGRRAALAAGLLVAVIPSQVLFSSVAMRESLIWACSAGVAWALLLTRQATPRRLALGGALAAVLLLGLAHLRGQTLVAAAWALVLAAPWLEARGRLIRSAGALALAVVVPIQAGYGAGGWGLVQTAAPTLGATRTYMSMAADSAFTSTTLLGPVAEGDGGPDDGAGLDEGPATASGSSASGSTGSGSTGSGSSGGVSSGGGRGAETTPDVEARNGGRADTGSEGTPENTSDGAGPMGIAQRPIGEATNEAGEPVRFITGYGGAIYVVDDSMQANFKAIPRGFVATTFRPLPWEATSGGDLLAARVENLLWYVLYGLALVGIFLGRRLRELAYPVLFTGAVLAVASVTQGNVGTAFRHRGEVLWAVVVVAAVGVVAIRERRSAVQPSA